MSIEQLTRVTGDLSETLATCGEFDSMDTYELGNVFGEVAAIISILEKEPELGHLCLGNDLEFNLITLKTAAVSVNRAIPLKEKLEDLLGTTDWYEIQEIVDKLYENLIEGDEQ